MLVQLALAYEFFHLRITEGFGVMSGNQIISRLRFEERHHLGIPASAIFLIRFRHRIEPALVLGLPRC